MKQADVINTVANRILREGTELSGRNIVYLIEREYQYHGKVYKGDSSLMIDKITKIVSKNRRIEAIQQRPHGRHLRDIVRARHGIS